MSKKKKNESLQMEYDDPEMPEALREFYEKQEARKEKNKRKNRPIVFACYVFVTLFMVMFGYIMYYVLHDSEEVITKTSNKRQDGMAKYVTRGSILTADKEVIAETKIDSDGNETREYPCGSLFAHVAGFESYGKSGLELYSNYYLLSSGIDFMTRLDYELAGKKLPGDSVVTSLRLDLQQTAVEALGSAKGAVVVIEPSTGKILAMVSNPSFDPNDMKAVWDYAHTEEGEEAAVLLNRATQGAYAPGSTFKVLTALEYMRENPDYADYRYSCEGNSIFNGVKIKCAGSNAHGEQDLEQAFANSCNTCFSDIGTKLDMDKFRALCEDVMFNDSLPLNMGYTKSRFYLDGKSDWGEIPQTVIGQGDTSISPIHSAMIMSAIANGGMLMKPQLIDRVENVSGDVVEEFKPEEYKRLFTKDDVEKLYPLLEAVCNYGTASRYLADPPYYAAGKTGTAEVDENGTVNSWFSGFAGMDIKKPEVAISVIVEDYGTNNINASSVTRSVLDCYFSE